MTEREFSEFYSFCSPNLQKITASAVHTFGLEVILSLSEFCPSRLIDLALKRKNQIVTGKNESQIVEWRLACWDIAGNHEPETSIPVAFARALICMLFPIADAAPFSGKLLYDFTMFMEMAGDFESVFMSFRHLLLTP